eukprot:1279354-Rhodomonas_salina.1
MLSSTLAWLLAWVGALSLFLPGSWQSAASNVGRSTSADSTRWCSRLGCSAASCGASTRRQTPSNLKSSRAWMCLSVCADQVAHSQQPRARMRMQHRNEAQKGGETLFRGQGVRASRFHKGFSHHRKHDP